MQIDVQKQIVKLDGDVKREFSQKLTANIDSLEKRVEDTIFQHKESQCQIEENIEKLTTTLEHVSREVQGKQSRITTDIAEQASTTYDKMLLYIDKLKIDQKAELERVMSQQNVTDKAEKGQIQDQIITLLQQRKDDFQTLTDIIQTTQQKTQEQMLKIKNDIVQS